MAWKALGIAKKGHGMVEQTVKTKQLHLHNTAWLMCRLVYCKSLVHRTLYIVVHGILQTKKYFNLLTK